MNSTASGLQHNTRHCRITFLDLFGYNHPTFLFYTNLPEFERLLPLHSCRSYQQGEWRRRIE
ncbi:hypothetical protein HF668_01255 [Acidithiobacillus ferridurans]|uniref:hypothetical protein n=1 Tax=Acidithiobacillus ferridurans TaxID=1232575 RepID=UPI001C0784B9|nr:hypothetical protein [Acidithiobacillus ferridurans]MBU2803813.1 hypothetical protein [Acidithiobacillus ferridurans]